MPLVSLLPKPDKPPTAVEFEQARAFGLEFTCERRALPDVLTSSLGDAWHSLFPLSPVNAFRVYARNLTVPPKVKIDVDVNPHAIARKPAIFAKIDIQASDGKSYGFRGDRVMNFHSLTNGGGDLAVNEDCQGQGIGRTIFGNGLEMAAICGLRRHYMTAGRSAGGVVWALAGVHLNMGIAYQPERDLLSQTLRATLKAIESYLPGDVVENVRPYLYLQKPDDMFHIAHQDYDLTHALPVGGFDNNSALFFILKNIFTSDPELKRDEPAVNAGALIGQINSAKKEAQRLGKPFTLGRLLLAEKKWHAVADLESGSQMQQIGSYKGGWNFVQWCDAQPAARP